MDFLPELSTLSEWLVQYGSVLLFVLFTLGIIILPIPEETLLIVAGTLVRQGKLALGPTFIAASMGSICGITVSYLIGRSFGIFFIHKYGKWVGLTQKRLQKAHMWFEKYGKWTLTIGYFIPGVRHFTGLSAGAAKLDLKQFMFFAYSGALFWVCLFLLGGYYFGNMGLNLFEHIEFSFDNLIIGLAAIAVIGFAGYILIRRYKKKGR